MKIILILLIGLVYTQSCTNASAVTPVTNVSSSGKIPGVYDKRILPALKAIIKGSERSDASDFYNWTLPYRCNVGLLGQYVLQVSEEELKKIRHAGEWKQYIISNCDKDYFNRKTRETDEILQKFHEAGFTDSDLKHIEFLNDPKITQYTGPLRAFDFKDYITYLKVWVDSSQFQ